jgi:membrane protein
MQFIKGTNRKEKLGKLVLPGFNLLMALLPASIFLFTLIPFIPIPNFQEELIRLFESILPVNAFSFLETTIVDIVTNKSGGLLIFMFIATVIFSTNGIHAVIHSFVVSAHSFKSRTWRSQRMVILIWLYLNSIALLIGFELNVSIKDARYEEEERLRTISCNEETV